MPLPVCLPRAGGNLSRAVAPCLPGRAVRKVPARYRVVNWIGIDTQTLTLRSRFSAGVNR